ncbi:MAG TPA: DUF192 domain-containing protein [Candidatus Limnocylindria bacterium]|jgi:uncharacterized membrane protein (UPF0127 family)
MTDTSRRARVMNATRGTQVAAAMRVATSMGERMIGLLRTSEADLGDGLLIEHTPSIHMFFMPYPIDALFVDGEGRVTRTVPGLRPWRVVWWARGARDCLELPVGRIAESGTQVGDILETTTHPGR